MNHSPKKIKFKISVATKIYITYCIFLLIVSGSFFLKFKTIACDTSIAVEDAMVECLNDTTMLTGIVSAIFIAIVNRKKQRGLFLEEILLVISMFFGVLFFRIAEAISLSINVVLFGYLLFCIVYLIFIAICLPDESEELQSENYINTYQRLNKELCKITNQKILSVQLFDVDSKKEGEYTKYLFRCKNGIALFEDCDVNEILSASYYIKTEYVQLVETIRQTFQQVIASENPYNTEILLGMIAYAKKEFLKELGSLDSISDIKKSDCCTARLFVILDTLEHELRSKEIPVVFDHKILGLSNHSIERALFNSYRTGILGGLFASTTNRMYVFGYRKNGLKSGRKYVAFSPLGNKKIVCVVIIRENESNRVTNDIMENVNLVSGIMQKVLMPDLERGV